MKNAYKLPGAIIHDGNKRYIEWVVFLSRVWEVDPLRDEASISWKQIDPCSLDYTPGNKAAFLASKIN